MKQLRLLLHSRQEDFGRLFQLSGDAISVIERGKVSPNLHVLETLTNMGVRSRWLLTGEGSMLRANITEGPFAGIQQNSLEHGTAESVGLPVQWLDQEPSTQANIPSFLLPNVAVSQECFLWRMPDESMAPLLSKGEILIIEKTNHLEDQRMFVFERDGKRFIRRVSCQVMHGWALSTGSLTNLTEFIAQEDLEKHNTHTIGRLIAAVRVFD